MERKAYKLNQFNKESFSDIENVEAKTAPQRKNMTKEQVMEYIGFTKFKNRLLTIRLVKSLLLTVGLSFVACGVTLILTKQGIWEFSPWFSLLFMALVGAITFACVFLPLSVNDKRLAIKLDEKFSLKERMQTSYENLSNHSEMSVLLRQDLKRKTEKISSSKIKARGLVICILIAVVGLGTLIAGIAVKKKEEAPPSPPPPPVVEIWELTTEQELALKSFATEVSESDMVSPAKEELVAKINELISTLKATTNEDDAYEAILLCVAEMDLITFNTGSSGAIYKALITKETAFAREIARALTRREKYAYDQKMSDALISIKHKYDGLEVLTKEQQNEMKIDTLDLLTKIDSDLKLALSESGVNKSDTLYKMIEKLLKLDDGERMGISVVLGIYDIIGYGPAKGEIENLWSTLLVTRDIYLELEAQRVNYDIGYGASDGIRELFGFTLPVREDLSTERPKDESAEEEEDDKQESAGGYGPGEILGTDELIYDKEYNQSIITFKIYSKYKEIMEKSDFTEEQKKIIADYFELLLNGYEGEKENG